MRIVENMVYIYKYRNVRVEGNNYTKLHFWSICGSNCLWFSEM